MLKTIEVDAHGGIRLLQPSPKAQQFPLSLFRPTFQ
jgi:hypothetical protein